MHSKDELCYSYLVLGCIVWESARKKRKALKECLKRTTIHCSISSNSYYYNNFPRHYRLTTLLKANYFVFSVLMVLSQTPNMQGLLLSNVYMLELNSRHLE